MKKQTKKQVVSSLKKVKSLKIDDQVLHPRGSSVKLKVRDNEHRVFSMTFNEKTKSSCLFLEDYFINSSLENKEKLFQELLILTNKINKFIKS